MNECFFSKCYVEGSDLIGLPLLRNESTESSWHDGQWIRLVFYWRIIDSFSLLCEMTWNSRDLHSALLNRRCVQSCSILILSIVVRQTSMIHRHRHWSREILRRRSEEIQRSSWFSTFRDEKSLSAVVEKNVVIHSWESLVKHFTDQEKNLSSRWSSWESKNTDHLSPLEMDSRLVHHRSSTNIRRGLTNVTFECRKSDEKERRWMERMINFDELQCSVSWLNLHSIRRIDEDCSLRTKGKNSLTFIICSCWSVMRDFNITNTRSPTRKEWISSCLT